MFAIHYRNIHLLITIVLKKSLAAVHKLHFQKNCIILMIIFFSVHALRGADYNKLYNFTLLYMYHSQHYTNKAIYFFPGIMQHNVTKKK